MRQQSVTKVLPLSPQPGPVVAQSKCHIILVFSLVHTDAIIPSPSHKAASLTHWVAGLLDLLKRERERERERESI